MHIHAHSESPLAGLRVFLKCFQKKKICDITIQSGNVHNLGAK